MTKHRTAELSEISETHTLGGNVLWELDLFNRVKNKKAIAQAKMHSAEDDLKYAKLLLVNEIAENYFLFRASEEKMQLKQQNLDYQEDVVKLVQSLVQEKRESPHALDRALAELNQLKIIFRLETNTLLALQNRLAVLVVEQPGHWRVPPVNSSGSALQIKRVAIGDISDLLINRPDVRKAERAIEIRGFKKQLAVAEYYPHFNVLGFLGAGSVNSLGDSETQGWSAEATLSWNLLNFNRVAKDVSISASEQELAVYQYEQTVLNAIEEAENALQRYSSSQQRLEDREVQLRHIESVANVERYRYEEGIGSYLAVLMAQREAIEARLTLVDDLASQRLATAGLFKTLGTSSL